MNRFITLSLPLVLAAGIAAVPANSESLTAQAIASPEASVVDPSTTTSYRCCWYFFGGMWICIPCDQP